MTTGQVGYGGGGRVLAAWQRTQAWRSARQAMTQQFLADGKAAGTLFAAAWANHAEAAGDLALEAALDRIDAAAKQKQTPAAKTPALPARDPIIRTDSGTVIDLEKNTITLADGTLLDLRSGAKLSLII